MEDEQLIIPTTMNAKVKIKNHITMDALIQAGFYIVVTIVLSLPMSFIIGWVYRILMLGILWFLLYESHVSPQKTVLMAMFQYFSRTRFSTSALSQKSMEGELAYAQQKAKYTNKKEQKQSKRKKRIY